MNCITIKRWEIVTIDAIIYQSIEHTKRLPALAALDHGRSHCAKRLQRASLPSTGWQTRRGGESTRLAAITLARSAICDRQGGEISCP